MDNWKSEKLRIAVDMTARLGKVAGVSAITLGGSLARGRAKADSDVDIGVYYQPESKPSIEALKSLAAEVDDSGVGDSVTGFGEWGPWINGGAWLTVDGHRVDWLYRDLSKVEGVVQECIRGKLSRYIQPGHPHGFPSHFYLGEIHHGRVLFDPTGSLAELKTELTPYPSRLKRAIIETYLWQAGFALDVSEKPVARGESSYAVGCFFECAYDLVQVLYALNEKYYMNEKGAVGEVDAFEHGPEGFAATVHDILGRPGHSAEELTKSLKRLRMLLMKLEVLAETYG